MKNSGNTSTLLIWVLIVSFFFCFASSKAQDTSNTSGLNPVAFKLFQSDELIELTISLNMNEVLRDVGDDRIYHNITISYMDITGQQITIPARIRTRGHFRRDPVNCNFPPLRLDFSELETVNTIFEGQDAVN